MKIILIFMKNLSKKYFGGHCSCQLIWKCRQFSGRPHTTHRCKNRMNKMKRMCFMLYLFIDQKLLPSCTMATKDFRKRGIVVFQLLWCVALVAACSC